MITLLVIIKRIIAYSQFDAAWAWPDLNRRPLGYEPSALTGLSYRPKINAPPTGLEPVTFWLLLFSQLTARHSTN
jgi:hypothetical protein